MGVIKAMKTSLKGEFAEQWLEVFASEGFEDGILLKRGTKIVSSKSSNTKGSGDVISNGSVIIVNDGEAAVSTENGKILEVYREPGENKFRSDNSSGIFGGGGLKSVFKSAWSRFGFGGDVHIVQRIYYINTKEIMGLRFETKGGFPVRITDDRMKMDIDMMAEMSGCFSIRISDPEKFFNKTGRNENGAVTAAMLEKQMTAEALSVLQSSATQLFSDGGRANELPSLVPGISQVFTQNISEKWQELRGISVVSMAISHFSLTAGDQADVTSAQQAEMFTDPVYASAALNAAKADAIKTAAKNVFRND